MSPDTTPGAVVLVGCGRLGSAILEGWLATGAIAPERLVVLTPSSKPAADVAQGRGARINPDLNAIGPVDAVLLAVKPAVWREATASLTAVLNGAVVVSVMAGIRAGDIEAVLQVPVARAMPTTAVAQARGVAALWSDDALAREMARTLFSAVADVVDLEDEALIDAATAVAGSAPAFIYAFVEALARAGEEAGLSGEAAARLARGALRSAGAGVDTDAGLTELIGRIASPGGTTRAGLEAMTQDGGPDRLAGAAVSAAIRRAKELSA
ncbi:pyrroline-5-carboxylate reductase family protein [Brevundimonas sp. NPDC092305]|uniref:pyrroline-5-carboxylate reductase family protein n=1 Tax=Brevundimonas sp. NPDC092305 TaxID=3363957 RepID=UPI003827E880